MLFIITKNSFAGGNGGRDAGTAPYFFEECNHRWVFIDHRLTQIDTDYEPKALIRMIIDKNL